MKVKTFFTEGKWHSEQTNRNYNLVFKEVQKHLKITSKQIHKNLKAKFDADMKDIPHPRTIRRVLNKMEKQKVVRKEKNFFIYTPYDIFQSKWLDYFDLFFQKIAKDIISDPKQKEGYAVDNFLKNHVFMITPESLGVCKISLKPDSYVHGVSLEGEEFSKELGFFDDREKNLEQMERLAFHLCTPITGNLDIFYMKAMAGNVELMELRELRDKMNKTQKKFDKIEKKDMG